MTLRRQLLAALLPVAAMACGASQSTDESGDRVYSERLIACDTLLDELRDLDLEAASESDLMHYYDLGQASAPTCRTEYLRLARTPGEAAIADHRGDQMVLLSLLVEGAINRRFDASQGYCTIIQDAFRVLLEDLAGLEQALNSGELSDADSAKITELRDLDLEAIDVLVAGNDRLCSITTGE